MLPFQVSVLGFASPAVSGTNLVFNLTSIPGSVLRYLRERRVIWPLTAIMSAGTIPGVLAGGFMHGAALTDPRRFKFFVGCVLMLLGARMALDILSAAPAPRSNLTDRNPPADRTHIRDLTWKRWTLGYRWAGEFYTVHVLILLAVSLVVGLLGGAYGIGGGALMAPLLVAVFRLPVHTVAGATLLTTFIASAFGAVGYSWLYPLVMEQAVGMYPDWPLGAMFGAGGLAGGYVGARLQKRLPARLINAILTGIILFVSLRYIIGYLVS